MSSTSQLLNFSVPSDVRFDQLSTLKLYQPNGRLVVSVPLHGSAVASENLTVSLPFALSEGIYLFRFDGVEGAESAGLFTVVK